MVGTLRSLFVGRREDMPSIEADVAGRRLVIRGTAEQLVQIRTVLQQLGEDGQGGAGLNGVGEGPIRTLSAGKRDPKDLMSLVERIWSTSTDRNPIHIVVPSAISPATRNIPERRVPSAPPSESGGEEEEELQEDDLSAGAIVVDEPKSEDRGQKSEVSEPGDARKGSGSTTDDLLRELMQLLDEEAQENSSVKPAGKANTKPAATKPNADGDATPERRPTGKSSKLPIAISSNGNNLIISSDDLEALDRLERLIQSLTQNTSSSGTRWTVFYLRSADAAETATMLGHLFPTGSVSKTSTDSTLMGSLTSGFSSLGGSLMDMTGLNSLGKDTALRIIPEPRSNALFISGTDDQIRQVEDVLKILDAAEMPESLKDRSQHMLALEYADVQDVLEIVKDVYKEEIEGQSNPFSGGGGRGGSSNMNPLAMMMGGMAGAQGGRGKGPQLTVGVDSRTNTLIVNANDKLFKQVETLVKSVDEAAKVAKQTVRVIPLENANSTIVSQALGSMLGKVKVSTTGGSSTRDSSSRGSSSSSQSPFGMSPFGMSPFGSSGSSSSDAMRQYWQSRMSGGSPFGGGGFPSSDGGRSSDRGRSSDSGRSRGDR
jgi:type II secretory pathway component GspD/PulD (secretin)